MLSVSPVFCLLIVLLLPLSLSESLYIFLWWPFLIKVVVPAEACVSVTPMWMLGRPLLMKDICRNLLYERFETAHMDERSVVAPADAVSAPATVANRGRSSEAL